MISALVIALSSVGFGLLVFGERMGLGAQWAAWGVAGIFIAAALALALASMTSRLSRFMVGAERGASLGFAASVAILLLGVATDRAVDASANGAVALIVGLVVASLLSPFNPWRNFSPLAARLHGEDNDPGKGSRGALAVMMTAGLFAALLIAFQEFPGIIARVVGATGWHPQLIVTAALGLLVLIALLGGLHGLARTAKVLIVLALATVAAPFLVFIIREFLDQFTPEFSRQLVETGFAGVRDGVSGLSLRREAPSLALGFILGVLLLQPASAVPGRAARGLALCGGILLALALGGLARIGQLLLQDIVSQRIVGVSPGQWPLFVFDETLRGWLKVCGAMPEDALSAARACASPGARAVLPAGSVLFEHGLDAPALALAQGWPIILGFIWGLLIPLFGLMALGLLLHAGASGLAERIGFRTLAPKALRSWRLAIARLSLLAIAAALYFCVLRGLRLPQPVFVWALLGAAGTAFTAMLAARLIGIIRYFRARRRQVAG